MGRGKNSGPLRDFKRQKSRQLELHAAATPRVRRRRQKSELAEGVMTSQAKWFSFGATVGLPVALLASQLHWVAGFNVAVAVVKAQWCYLSTVSEANALKASLPSIPNLQRIKAAQTRLAELNRQLDDCARNDPPRRYNRGQDSEGRQAK
jgi:hypothetical protein